MIRGNTRLWFSPDIYHAADQRRRFMNAGFAIFDPHLRQSPHLRASGARFSFVLLAFDPYWGRIARTTGLRETFWVHHHHRPVADAVLVQHRLREPETPLRSF